MSDRAHPIRLSLFYWMLFLTMGIIVPYWPVWLRDQGLDPGQIGILLALTYLSRTLANTGIGALVDWYGDRRLPMVALAASSLCIYLIFFFAHGFWPILLLTILAATTFTTLMPLGDSMTMLESAERGLDYGRIRLWGSLAFIAASTLGGVVLERSSSAALLWLIILFVLGLLGACAALPDTHAEARPRDPGEDRLPLRRLLAQPVFLLFLGATSLIQASHMVYYGFGTMHWQEAGLPGDLIGLLWAEGVLAEIVIFAWSGAVLSRLGPARMILLAGLAATLRWTVFGLTTAPLPLILVQGLHAFTFGAFYLGAMHFIGRAAPRSLSAGAQGLFAAVTMGLVPGLALLVVGPLFGALGGAAFFAAALMALAASALALRLGRRWHGGEISLPPPSRPGRARAWYAGTGRGRPSPPDAPRC